MSILTRTFGATGLFLFALPTVEAALSPSSSTTAWSSILYPGGPSTDPFSDQQTGDKEGDIVGTATHPSLYKQFDDGGTAGNLTDGTIGFRLRVSGESSPPGFQGAFYVGADVNADGAVDLFLGVITQGSRSEVGLYAPGTGLNISPSTSSINTSTPLYFETISSANYNWQAVTLGVGGTDPAATTNDVDANGRQDFFLSFALPFQRAILAFTAQGRPAVTEQTPMTFIAATAQNPNSLNQDLNGVGGSLSSTSSFATLGAVTQMYSSAGTLVVPEPTATALLLAGGAFASLARRRGVAGGKTA